MLAFLKGSDRYRVREREKELARDFVQQFPLAERVIFDDAEAVRGLALRIREQISGGLFSAPALIHIRDLTQLIEDDESGLKDVLVSAKKKSEVLILVTDTVKTKKMSAFQTWLTKQGTTERFPAFDPKKPEALASYGRTLVAQLAPSLTIEPKALALLAEWTGGESGVLAREIEKLAAFKNGGTVVEADVIALSPEPVASRAFGALDALISNNRTEALALFRREEKLAVPFQQTLGLCAWHLRLILGTKELFDAGVRGSSDIARELGSSPYPIQKIIPRLSHLSLDRLKRGLTLLADLDLGIRSGQMQPSIALDLFVWKF